MKYTLEEFIEVNQGFLYRLAKFYASNTDLIGIEFDDLYQVGCLALINRYHDYDTSKGALSTFSYFVIKGAMLNYIRNNATCTHVSTDILILARKYARENNLFYKVNGRYMTFEEQKQWIENQNYTNYKDSTELVKILNKVNLFHYKSRIYSIEDEIINYDVRSECFDSDAPVTFSDCIHSDDDIETEVLSKISMEEFINSLTYLKERDKDIFIETLGLYDDIPKKGLILADKHSISHQWVNKIYHKTLEKVKTKCKNNLI